MTRTVLAATSIALACAASFAAGQASQSPGVGATYVSGSGLEITLLLDRSTLGTRDADVAEITFPAGADSGDHVHGSTEIFYVLSGELEHVVNGESTLLRPGMLGLVRPPDRVRHRTTAETRALVIWLPGGEAERILRNWKRR